MSADVIEPGSEQEAWGASMAIVQADMMATFTRSYRDAIDQGPTDIATWRPSLASADYHILADNKMVRARARDAFRNNPYAKNAARMRRDASAGIGLRLALKIDWRSLGIDNIEAAAEWTDFVTRAWHAYAEGVDFNCDAARQLTFSQMFGLIDTLDFVDGESLTVLELKPGSGIYQTCAAIIDIDRLDNPPGTTDTPTIRGGIERDAHGEPLAYFIREAHQTDVGLSFNQFKFRKVPRTMPWGRTVVMHTYERHRAEQSRGISEFASTLKQMRMLDKYGETELTAAAAKAAMVATIKTDLDWTAAGQVLGAKVMQQGTKNPFSDLVAAHMEGAAKYHNQRQITLDGLQIPHLLPNETLDINRTTSNSAFADFEYAFIRQLAAGLGVEAHELSKNYRDVNYSAARAALQAVWRTYRARRERLVKQWAMPFFSAWLEEAVALETVPLPPGVTDFVAAKPYLCQGTFIAWGKPLIDPLKERNAQQIGITMGAETLEDVVSEDGKSWRDVADQLAYEQAYYGKLGLAHPTTMALPPPMPEAPPPAEQ